MRKRGRKIKQAIILAGGEGRRLRPYTRVLPKPLMPVGNTPIIEVLLRQLTRAGVREIIIAVGYHAQLIKLIIGDGTRFDAAIEYSIEDKPLGTAAPLTRIRGLDDNFLVLNGDLLTDMPFGDFIETHLRGRSLATIAVAPRKIKIDFGVVEAEGGYIDQYREKPVHKYMVSMGIYAFRRGILDYIPEHKFDFPDLVKKLISLKKNPSIFPYNGRWYDIGNPDDWEKADRIFQRKPKYFMDE